MTLAAIFTTAKDWKPLKCPSVDEGKTKCGLSIQEILFDNEMENNARRHDHRD